ncbi:unnamed protein product [Rotaria sordida]|uniref:Uncharacterized protein n=1 Tax=Rotaria sordida TaxID=392033 RepID=A0A815HQL5_9BILA|nr:unnamed protein product [Rotaria sordida]CAF1388711.1 unnamed protein product [Rotaria sordida]CAF1500866.1 unnamed protein product [Rotaria sordida]CAF1655127.1 unnamed protein product [Rotaria sordida]CAF4067264.1 unnamed protein product [Rotaria sordida]
MSNENLIKKDQTEIDHLTKFLIKNIDLSNEPNFFEFCFVSFQNNSLEKCVVCALPITDRIFRVTGKRYNGQGSSCMQCQKSVDGIPFTIYPTMQIDSIDCFHEKFPLGCYVCNRTILSLIGQ